MVQGRPPLACLEVDVITVTTTKLACPVLMLNYLLVSSCSRADLVSDDPLNTGRDSTTRVAVVLLMQSAYIYPSLNYTVLDKEYNQLIALHTTMCFQSLNCCYRCL